MPLLPVSTPLSDCDLSVEPMDDCFHVQFTFGPNVIEDRIVEMSSDLSKITRYFTDKSFHFRAAPGQAGATDPPNKIVLQGQEDRVLLEIRHISTK